MAVRALRRSDAIRIVLWLRPCTSCKAERTLRASDIHNSRETIPNPFNSRSLYRTMENGATPSIVCYVYQPSIKQA